MPIVVQLARQLYTLRLDELKKAINEDEEKFLSLVAEIDDIRAGKWDNQLLGLSTTSETNSPLKEVESANSSTVIESTTPAITTTTPQTESLNSDTITASTYPIVPTNTSDKQQYSPPSGENLEKLAEQEIAAEEAKRVEIENIGNETRDVRKEDVPPITIEEQKKIIMENEENIPTTTTTISQNQDATTPNSEISPEEKELTTIPEIKQVSPSTYSDVENNKEQKSETVSLKRHLDENEGIEVSDLKRQKTDRQPSSIAESVAGKISQMFVFKA
jgi:bromodomain-containing protein 8